MVGRRGAHAGREGRPPGGRLALSRARPAGGGDRMSVRRADVAIVGAGPAGAALAILLAEHGVDVVVLDRAALPRAKICGEYLSPEAARVLDRLGVLKALDAAGAAALAGMRITGPDGTTVTGRYRPLGELRPYRQHAMGVAGETLDGALLERLRGLPVDLREGTRVGEVIVEDGQVVGVRAEDRAQEALEVRAAVVVGADGRHSVVAERLGCRHAHTLRRLALVTYVRGVLLVGDAAGFYDPFTGEGVFTALRSAELAADTIVRALRARDVSAAALGAYERARRAAFDGKARVTRALQTVIGHRRLATWICRRLARRPAALDALLGVVGDYVPPRALPGALSAALGFRTPR